MPTGWKAGTPSVTRPTPEGVLEGRRCEEEGNLSSKSRRKTERDLSRLEYTGDSLSTTASNATGRENWKEEGLPNAEKAPCEYAVAANNAGGNVTRELAGTMSVRPAREVAEA